MSRRRRALGLGVATAMLASWVAGPARAQDSIVCPPGTTLGESTRPSPREQWCERPGTNPKVLDGPFASWHPDGAVHVRGEYRDGKPTGTWKSWHPTGAQSGEVAFVDGKPTGMLLGWYTNGQASFVGGFRDGTAIGMMEVFDPEGRMRGSVDFGPDGKERSRRAWDDANRAIDPKSSEAHSVEMRAVQSSLLIDMAVMASSVVR